MTSTNLTIACTSPDGILAEKTERQMGIAQSNSKKMAGIPLRDDESWEAVMARDPNFDGKFVFAVATTGIYCRPSCAARRPRRENVTFFSRPEQAEKAGFRACLRCRPRSFSGNPQSDVAKEMCRYIEQHLDEPITLERLGKAFRLSPFHLQRRFKAALGITPREYADSCRMRQLKRNLQSGDNVTRAIDRKSVV